MVFHIDEHEEKTRIERMKWQKRRQLIIRMLFFFCIMVSTFGILDMVYFMTESQIEEKKLTASVNEGEDVLETASEEDKPIIDEEILPEPGKVERKSYDEAKAEEDDSAKSSYDHIYYYESDKQERYEAYQEDHVNMSPEEIVWRVNAGLDHQFYEESTPAVIPEDGPMLVNKYRYLTEDYIPDQLVSVGRGKKLQKEAADQFRLLKAAAKKEGYLLFPVSGFRTYGYQKTLHNNYLKRQSEEEVDRFSSREGYSEHQTGLALDVNSGQSTLREFADTPAAYWLEKNAADYGFIIRYPEGAEEITGYEYEPWHITYVGVAAAQDMKEKGIDTLEEYYIKFIEHMPGVVQEYAWTGA